MTAPGDAHLAAFLAARPRLLRLAYRFLGSVAEAEDIVQEAWVRFAGMALVGEAARPLARIVTNLALDRLKSAQRRRETYVGAWLPEPIAGDTMPDEHGLDLSFAIMRALERLSPAERAALFLHDLFDFTFEEIADTLQRTPVACRQLAARARKALQTDRPRYAPSIMQVEAFRAAFDTIRATGNVAPFVEALAADAVLVSDGGGKVPAVRDPLVGRDRVAAALGGLVGKYSTPDLRAAVAQINDAPGLLIFVGDRLEQTVSFDLDAAGRIAGIYIVRNPDKLARLAAAADRQAGALN
ncbi:MAG: RNA polymerase sigma factor SigJ [Proteobacteria bacterium]|nr:RNA polymerase sigma factor SigJ [Pseudomonadota bacterium]MDA1060108.1 RNA polymerase sigma factor SigJ [Pseudomonadota bacterium]